MALRTMLPSKAKVGDTIHFSFPHVRYKGKSITAFQVIINGNKISNPEMVSTRASGGATSFVFKAATPGTHHFEITALIDGQECERRLNTLEVED